MPLLLLLTLHITTFLFSHTGERVALLTTRGFRDLQRIGNQSRPNIFDLQIKRPDLLYEAVYEVDERVVLCNPDADDDGGEKDILLGLSQERIKVEQSIDEVQVRDHLSDIQRKGITSIAVVFMHSYTFAQHEQTVRSIATSMGFQQISLSSDVMPMVRIVPRGCTTIVDAYLTPIIKRYLESFSLGFDANFANLQVSFMQSDGGLTPMAMFTGHKAILSGPAGGVVGYAQTSYNRDASAKGIPVIGFDMGGTGLAKACWASSKSTYLHKILC
jgi:5-oxoprolinase (ATP-hydrolysing)